VKISIITVCFNSGETIKDTIDSVLSQDYKEIEYIVIDGLSKDNTLNILSAYKDEIAVTVSEPDEGIYDAMNKGIELATGDVIGILNSDDKFNGNSVISEVMDCFAASPDSVMVFGDVVYVDSLDTTIITRFYSAIKFRSWKLRFGWMPPHPATFIKKSIYDKVGVYSDKYRISADYEWFVRALLVYKLPFLHINKVLVRMRSGGVSTSGVRSSILLNSEIIKACRTNGVYTNFIFLTLKIPFKILELLKRPEGNS